MQSLVIQKLQFSTLFLNLNTPTTLEPNTEVQNIIYRYITQSNASGHQHKNIYCSISKRSEEYAVMENYLLDIRVAFKRYSSKI